MMEELREQAAKLDMIISGLLDTQKLIEREPPRNTAISKDMRESINALAQVSASLRALPAPVALPQAGAVEPVAWLKEWTYLGQSRSRIDRRRDCEPWLSTLNPTITPLYACTPTETPTAAAPDDGLMGRYREALEEARRGFDAVQVLMTAMAGGRKSIMVETFAEKIDAALSTATGDEAQQGEG